MHRRVWATLALGLALAACSPRATTPPATAGPSGDPVSTYLRVYGGLEGVYRSILAENDCDALQEQFWTATENKTLGYQAAIDERAKALDCPALTFNRQ